MTASLPDVFAYSDYRRFLRDALGADGDLTLRGLARSAGCSPALLSSALRESPERRRNLGTEKAEGIARALRMPPDDSDFFLLLVRAENAKAPSDRARLQAQISAIHRFHEARVLRGDALRLFSEWRHLAIFELAGLPEFDSDPEWIAQTLRPRITAAEAEHSLSLLQRLKLICRSDGGVQRTCEHARAPMDGSEAERGALQGLHLWLLQRAAGALTEVPNPADGRRSAALVFASSPRSAAAIQARIQQCQREILEICERDAADRPADRVYALSVQLFPLSGSVRADGPE